MRRAQTSRPGFTLIELLIVIAIIAILVALLAAAVYPSKKAVHEAHTAMEIKQLEAGIAAFQADRQIPVSSLTLYEDADGWAADPASRSKVKMYWSNFNFTLDRNLNYFSGDADTDDVITLTGPECLVFFLGGMLDASGRQPMGFSMNVENPFAPPTGSGQRDGPFFEFDLSRLVDDGDGDGFPVYIDPLPGHAAPYAPYLYASNHGQGYQVADLTVGSALAIGDVYRVSNNGVPINPRTFQIISPGYDHVYGNGGTFNPESPNSGLSNADDFDNITNFNPSRLRP